MIHICGIMACDPSGIVGKDGKLPWSYPKELKHFSDIVSGNIMIMGYKTFIDTSKHILNNCYNIVLSRKDRISHSPNTIFIKSIDELFNLSLDSSKKIFMIGGAEIATLFLQNNLISEFILTIICKNYQGNVEFPLFIIKEWKKEIIKQDQDFTVYKYIKP